MSYIKNTPYIEPTIRTIAGGLLLICGLIAICYPNSRIYWLGALFFIAINLFQSGLTRFCLMEKLLKNFGFRSEMDEIRALSILDPLTDLPNRAGLETEIEKAISLAQRHHLKVAMLFIDLDNFKQINDIQGHKVGDELLITVSEIVKANLRKYDILARWGGDEFVAVIPDIKHSAQVQALGEKIMLAVNKELRDKEQIQTTLSIGAAIYPDDANNMDALLIQADKALFHAKAQGRNNLQIFSDIKEQSVGFLSTEITSRFAHALKDKKIDVHYQPLVDAQSNEIVCVEALARWKDETSGWISPEIFIPLAENIGLIEDLGDLVLEKSLAHFAFSRHNQDIRLAVNVSNRQLFSKSFLHNIIQRVHSHNIKTSQIKLEITESSALETENALNTLYALSEAGFYISMDDFGTGFSSLSQLHHLPLNELKIDMSFVHRINTDEGRVMLETIVSIGKAMGLNIVAEGVEDELTAHKLRDMGVDQLQGFYFSRPIPPEKCRMFLERKTA